MTDTVVLCVVLGAVDTASSERLSERFGSWYDESRGEIEYPVLSERHGQLVFTNALWPDDEKYRYPVDFASLVEVPYEVRDFKPFTESGEGTEISQWAAEDGWVKS